MATIGIIAASAVLMAGCGKQDDRPDVVADRTACGNCKMLVSETVHATAFKVGDDYQIFDDLGCMLDQLAKEPTLRPTKYLVRDQRSSEWLDANTSFYVHSSELKTPMSYGYCSYSTKAQADVEATKSNGELLSGFSELTAHFMKDHAKK